ncbi:hypothetical protein QQS21_011728 [Conoideocrella luteorostrata]|uniref:CENP-V/GFA domain-containing protein n=1 Tax=Conoideocrella luteorostrata TaxID=1105319 RepID=A0AAJ0CDL8_9HYPO|nr:hypothetical protein QQS21_011728 [Conoideocrella luteorostrata]
MAAALTHYHGYCHCGAFRFDLNVPEITQATACDCSLCQKKGYLWIVPAEDSYRITRDDGLLATYESASLRHKFCGRCATGITGEHLAGPMKGQVAINLLAVREVNPFRLEENTTLIHVDEPQRTIESLPGDSSEATAQHLFACHCGSVQCELLTPITEQDVKQDNCSSCIRKAYIGVYPSKDQVRIHGGDHTTEYQFGKKFGGDHHCKTCGVFVFATVYGPPLSVFDKVPPERKEHVLSVYYKNIQMKPLNVRCMEGVDIPSLTIDKNDYGDEDYVLDP